LSAVGQSENLLTGYYKRKKDKSGQVQKTKKKKDRKLVKK